MSPVALSLDDVLARLRREVTRAGSQSALADEWGISGTYVSDVLNKRREPGSAILSKLGLDRGYIEVGSR